MYGKKYGMDDFSGFEVEIQAITEETAATAKEVGPEEVDS
jgi:hypothetical protein